MFQITLPPVALDARLAWLVEGLCRMVAAHSARDRTAGPLILLVWTSIRRRATRLAALLALFRAGKLPKPRAARPTQAVGSATAGRERVRPEPAPLRMPRGKAWLARWIVGTGGYGEQVRVLLDDPEMAALIAASPQARRLLRPLCSMLGVNPVPPGLVLPPAARKARRRTVRARTGGRAPERARSRVGRPRLAAARRDGAGRFSPT